MLGILCSMIGALRIVTVPGSAMEGVGLASHSGYVTSRVDSRTIPILPSEYAGSDRSPVFFAVTGDPSMNQGYLGHQTTDNGYIVVGVTHSVATGNDILLMKYDESANIVWTRAVGGAGYDVGRSVRQTLDGGYVVVGETTSFGAGYEDVIIIKFDPDGNLIWAKTFGGEFYDFAWSVQQTTDLGYIVAGYTASFGAGYYDVLLLKYDATGAVTWAVAVGGYSYDEGMVVQQTNDGGYIVSGETRSFGESNGDLLLVKLTASGSVVWARTAGGAAEREYGSSVQQTTDGGYIITGATGSYGAGSSDALLVKYDNTGTIVWGRTIGGAYLDQGHSVQQMPDGGYQVAGMTYSYGPGYNAILLFKVNALGNLSWARTIGGDEYEYARSVQVTSDGGFVVTGWTSSYGAGDEDVVLIKTTSDGTIQDCSAIALCYPSASSPSLTASAPPLTALTISGTITSPTIVSSSPSFNNTAICMQSQPGSPTSTPPPTNPPTATLTPALTASPTRTPTSTSSVIASATATAIPSPIPTVTPISLGFLILLLSGLVVHGRQRQATSHRSGAVTHQ